MSDAAGMSHQQPHILILFTETGGTHANAARAIIEALDALPDHPCTVELIDVWKYAKFPLNKLPRMISWFRERQPISRWNFQNSQKKSRLDRFNFLAKPYLRRRIQSILKKKEFDLIVSVHPVTTAPILEVIPEGCLIPFWTIVTDIATKNVFWFDVRAEQTIVPSAQAMSSAAQFGIPYEKVALMGIPVPHAYHQNPYTREEVCREYGLNPSNPIVLVAGGKAGVGPLAEVAQRIDERFGAINLLLLAGNNERLQQRLCEYNWANSNHVFGFVNDLWRLMWAADVMVTKAGTGMTAEALSVSLPMIIFHRVPYFEDANVSFLVENGAALWAPTSRMVVNGLVRWLNHPEECQNAREACRRLAKPKAAVMIAKWMAATAEKHFNGIDNDDSQ